MQNKTFFDFSKKIVGKAIVIAMKQRRKGAFFKELHRTTQT
jgi:hypothetical protein